MSLSPARLADRFGPGRFGLGLSALLACLLLPPPATAQSASGSIVGTDPPPPAPKNFTATAVSSSRIDLSWSPVTQAEDGLKHYNLYREGQRIAQITATSYSDKGLQADQDYDYEVAAVDGKGREGSRARASATTPEAPDDDDDDDDDDSDDSPPSRPGGLQVSARDASTVDVSWSRASDPESGIKEYVIYRDGREVARVSGTSYVDGGLQAATAYAYEVSAVNGDGLEGAKAGPVTAVTPSIPDVTPPTAPSDLSATAEGAHEIRLTWSAARDPESGIKEYVIYREGREVARVSGTSYLDGGLQAAAAYSYEVSAVNGDGLEGAKAGPVTAATPSTRDATPPTAPSDLSATAEGAHEIRLTWSAARDPESGISGYRVYRDNREVAFVSSPQLSDAGLEADTRYVYRVAAVNGEGVEGPSSSEVAVQTVDTVPPAPPTGLRIVP